MQSERLIVFVKAPRTGCVKTRLARTIGDEAACAAYRRLVEMVLESVSDFRGVELRFAPDDAEAEIRSWLCPGWEARPQREGNLGERLQSAFADAFAAGATRVVIIGSDCPEVTGADVHEAWDQLRSADVVIGPAVDGGYWLIGLRQERPEIFSGITWSSENVLAETLQRARAAGLRIQLLRILADVDTEKDWRGFLDRGKWG